jgi:hypothetical protein
MFRAFLAHHQEFLHCMVSRSLWKMCGCVVVWFGVRWLVWVSTQTVLWEDGPHHTRHRIPKHRTTQPHICHKLWPPQSRGFYITHIDAPDSRTHLNEWSAHSRDNDNTQHSQLTAIHTPGGIRTHNHSWQATADLRLRSRGHWDRH